MWSDPTSHEPGDGKTPWYKDPKIVEQETRERLDVSLRSLAAALDSATFWLKKVMEDVGRI